MLFSCDDVCLGQYNFTTYPLDSEWNKEHQSHQFRLRFLLQEWNVQFIIWWITKKFDQKSFLSAWKSIYPLWLCPSPILLKLVLEYIPTVLLASCSDKNLIWLLDSSTNLTVLLTQWIIAMMASIILKLMTDTYNLFLVRLFLPNDLVDQSHFLVMMVFFVLFWGVEVDLSLTIFAGGCLWSFGVM